jgi:hypothetical protein
MDVSVGDGAYALLIHSNHDFMIQPDSVEKRVGFPTRGSLLLNTTFRYAYFLPDTEALHVCNIHNPICPNRDDAVRRKLGDVIEAEISPKVGLAKPLILYGVYRYAHKFKDHYAGDKGFDYGTLSNETDYNDHQFQVGLTFHTLTWFMEKTFPVPIVANLSYGERFAADNNLWKRRWIGFAVATYF